MKSHNYKIISGIQGYGASAATKFMSSLMKLFNDALERPIRSTSNSWTENALFGTENLLWKERAVCKNGIKGGNTWESLLLNIYFLNCVLRELMGLYRGCSWMVLPFWIYKRWMIPCAGARMSVQFSKQPLIYYTSWMSVWQLQHSHERCWLCITA